MPDVDLLMRDAVARSNTRFDLWINFISRAGIRCMAEVGVYRGDFAAAILQGCPSLERYYMIDPWRHLSSWNKPANLDDVEFARLLEETKRRTEFAGDKVRILRGTTLEVAEEIPDQELDLCYVDGDHTLRGITLDLLTMFPKVREGGCIGGDDFTPNMWQHGTRYEPTLVFPWTVYFAEAVGAPIFGCPFGQFLLQKDERQAFRFIDLAGGFSSRELGPQCRPRGSRFTRRLRNRVRSLARRLGVRRG